ncbi:hypothetical protein KSP40_PGU013511 [Platanthera guangdongensis]|uniref:Uncharacterized protein n=1 Tax=Platanthera guangdongensis TaxID=2320717 RepID=A0ABR2MD83_9ASPA
MPSSPLLDRPARASPVPDSERRLPLVDGAIPPVAPPIHFSTASRSSAIHPFSDSSFSQSFLLQIGDINAVGRSTLWFLLLISFLGYFSPEARRNNRMLSSGNLVAIFTVDVVVHLPR